MLRACSPITTSARVLVNRRRHHRAHMRQAPPTYMLMRNAGRVTPAAARLRQTGAMAGVGRRKAIAYINGCNRLEKCIRSWSATVCHRRLWHQSQKGKMLCNHGVPGPSLPSRRGTARPLRGYGSLTTKAQCVCLSTFVVPLIRRFPGTRD